MTQRPAFQQKNIGYDTDESAILSSPIFYGYKHILCKRTTTTYHSTSSKNEVEATSQAELSTSEIDDIDIMDINICDGYPTGRGQ